MSECIRCGGVILGDGTEDADWAILCQSCKGDDCYEQLVEDEE